MNKKDTVILFKDDYDLWTLQGSSVHKSCMKTLISNMQQAEDKKQTVKTLKGSRIMGKRRKAALNL